MGHVASELGATFPAVEGIFVASGADVISGQVMEVDLDLDYGTDMAVGATTSGLVKAEPATLNGTEALYGGRVLVVSRVTSKRNRPFRAVIQGIVPIAVGSAVDAGDRAILGSASNDNKRIWGYILEDSATNGRPLCLWDGVCGFGQIITGIPGEPTIPDATIVLPVPTPGGADDPDVDPPPDAPAGSVVTGYGE